MCPSKKILTDISDRSQLSGVQSDTSVTGTFYLNDKPDLQGKIDLSSGSDGVPVWTLTPTSSTTPGEKVPVGEGLWTVLDQGYIKFTGKLTTAKNLGLENKTYSGTINATFTSNNGNSMPETVTYGGKLFFKVIENQVVALAIPKPNSDLLSDKFQVDPEFLIGCHLSSSLVEYDKFRNAASDLLSMLDSEDKLWSRETKSRVSHSVGNFAGGINHAKYHISKALMRALSNTN